MKKLITIDPNAEKELDKFDERVRLDFDSLIKILGESGQLSLPDGKKIGKKLFEIRVMVEGAYRGIYAYIGKEGIVIFFSKEITKDLLKVCCRKETKKYE
jgi:mRNA-degrading endonuclease RelE of RelBE toxin-antitoxin system